MRISQTVTPASVHPLFLVFGVEFLEWVNGKLYPLQASTANNMTIVTVDALNRAGISPSEREVEEGDRMQAGNEFFAVESDAVSASYVDRQGAVIIDESCSYVADRSLRFSGLQGTFKLRDGECPRLSARPLKSGIRWCLLMAGRRLPSEDFQRDYCDPDLPVIYWDIKSLMREIMIGIKKANRLIHSTSPYLLQHAYNPVDWYEWGEEALRKAREEDKPILVSIGYSSCHWCHVMEREVFEKEDIAKITNEHLVCIKVDREERPDIDHVYMEAVQAMGVNGGWPLNVFLTPEQKPFYGGTYFPPEQWVQVVQGIHNSFLKRRAEIEESAGELAGLLAGQDLSRFKKDHVEQDLKDDLNAIYNKLQPAFDKTWGGLEKAPKFIMPSVWRWLLRYYKISQDEEALGHLTLTLNKIAMGGIYDQIGGGFARYSVDQYWFVPHFEKMLYDNAQLMSLYAEAFALTKEEAFKTVLLETFEWLQTEMMDGQGGFYSALDADSEGEEGKFYIWTATELREVLGEESEIFFDYYSIKEQGNWEADKNVLMRVQKEEDFLKKHQLSAGEWSKKLRRMKDELLVIRDKRIKPGLDDKIITGWNAMMVVGLVDAYKAVGDERFLNVALRNMRFLESGLAEGLTYYRSYKNKRSDVKAFLDDYAYLIQACTSVYQVTFDEQWIYRAKGLTEHVLENFYDAEDGFFYYAGKASEKLIATRKEIFDNVIPASNSVMAQNLYHLAVIFDSDEWRSMAEKMIHSLSHLILSEPNYMSNWGIAYTEMKKGMAEVVLMGKEAPSAARNIFQSFQPFALAMGSEGESKLPLLEGKASEKEPLTIYVCYNKTCQRPVDNVADALSQIGP